jgi:hypothetical protein
MSRLAAFRKGLTFRTNKPTFEPETEFKAFVTGYENETALVRLGDSVLRIPDAAPGLLDTQVRIRVEEFDDNDHTGRATVLEELGSSSY